jgi:HesB-like selenoprotein
MKILTDELTIEQVSQILNQNPTEPQNVRIYLEGFGCSGPTFGLALDNKNDNDEIINESGINFIMEDSLVQGYGDMQISYLNEGFYVVPTSKPQSACSTCASAGSCSI